MNGGFKANGLSYDGVSTKEEKKNSKDTFFFLLQLKISSRTTQYMMHGFRFFSFIHEEIPLRISTSHPVQKHPLKSYLFLSPALQIFSFQGAGGCIVKDKSVLYFFWLEVKEKKT